MNFIFGDGNEQHNRFVAENVKSLEHAIKIFKVDVLFPEGHVYQRYIVKNNYHSNYDGHPFYTHELEDFPEYYIPIYEGFREDEGSYMNRGAFVYEISLSECINVDYTKIIPEKTLLSGSVPDTGLVKAADKIDTSLVIGSKYNLTFKNKVALREMTNKIRQMQQELSITKDKLKEEVRLIQKEIGKKLRLIYILETFLGVHEEVIQIRAGEKAPEEEPLTLYQQLLFMDEEIGIWEKGGLDRHDLKLWDEWVLKHYEKFLYKPKSICAFRIRRNPKAYYHDEPLLNWLLNLGNFKTYFLIRNGENLYRIWSDVQVSEKIFPTQKEYDNIINETKEQYSHYKGYDDEDIAEVVREKLNANHDQYMYGFVAIQGLIERTDIFCELQGKVNLLSGKIGSYIDLVRDAEREYWLNSNMPTWSDYVTKNRETITKGTRIIVSSTERFYGRADSWRTSPFKPDSFPTMKEIHIVEEIRDSKKRETYWSWAFLIRYNPKDTIWRRNYWEENTIRKHRVPFRLYASEVLNFDKLTSKDIEYYEQNRLERENYLHILPILSWAKSIKKEEEEIETEFAKLVASGLHIDFEEYKDRIKEVIVWWKLKNKWKRALGKDEAKALRMVSRRVKSVYNIF